MSTQRPENGIRSLQEKLCNDTRNRDVQDALRATGCQWNGDPRTPMQRKLDAAKDYLREIGRARPGVLDRWMRARGAEARGYADESLPELCDVHVLGTEKNRRKSSRSGGGN